MDRKIFLEVLGVVLRMEVLFIALFVSMFAALCESRSTSELLGLLPPYCNLTDRFPELKGHWTEKASSDGLEGYDASQCPGFVHLTDCLGQAMNSARTEALYK